jgi:hypothetical protein
LLNTTNTTVNIDPNDPLQKEQLVGFISLAVRISTFVFAAKSSLGGTELAVFIDDFSGKNFQFYSHQKFIYYFSEDVVQELYSDKVEDLHREYRYTDYFLANDRLWRVTIYATSRYFFVICVPHFLILRSLTDI